MHLDLHLHLEHDQQNKNHPPLVSPKTESAQPIVPTKERLPASSEKINRFGVVHRKEKDMHIYNCVGQQQR